MDTSKGQGGGRAAIGRRAGAVLLAFVAGVVGIAPVAAGQDEPPPEKLVRCTKCKNVGARPCPEHKVADCELEHDVLYCSEMGGCEPCGGTGWIDCPHCVNEVSEAGLAALREALPARRAALAKLDEEMARPLPVVETAHFVLVCDLGPRKVEKRVLTPHEMTHLYAERLELLFADYGRILGVGESEFARKPRIMLWSQTMDHERASRRFCGGMGEAGLKLLGLDPNYSVPGTKQFFKDDEALHRNVIHNTVHLLLSHQRPILWIGNIKGGWADAGLAHWFEDFYWKKCDTYCYEEVDTMAGFKGGKWKPAIRKMVAAGDAPLLGDLMQQNTTTLTRRQHAVAFSVVDYLMELDAKKLNQVFKRLRGKASTRDALKDVYGFSVLQLEDRWKTWVLDTYPTR